jgi:chitinase
MIKKNYYLLLLLLLSSFVSFAQKPTHNKKVVGYYAQWAIYARDFNIGKIDGSKLTHLMYAFFNTTYDAANPQNTKLVSLDAYADFDHTENGGAWPQPAFDAPVKGNFYDLMKLKEKYPHLKVQISLGGWTKSQNLPYIAASAAARTALAQDMAAFLVKYPFIDGFDIDWEFPIIGGIDGTEIVGGVTPPAQPHTPDDHKNLVYLLRDMRAAMPGKLISIAAGNSVINITKQFIGPGNRSQFGMNDDITTYADFITFFGYDLGGNWYDKTCYNAPLYGSGNVNDPLNANNESLDRLTNIYLNAIGIPANKLIMGIPFYGKMFDRVANNGTVPNLPGLFVAAPRTTGSCANPQAPQGTWDAGFCEFTGSIEFCDLAGTAGTTGHHFLNPANPANLTASATAAGWVKYWDNTAKVPYLYNSTTKQFITYDDKQSIDEKGKYINSKNLGGAMIWELSQDQRTTDPQPAALLRQLNTTFDGGTVVLPPVSITGSVRNGTALITNVTVKLLDANNAVLSNITSTDGNYSFANLTNGGSYKVTAEKQLYTFNTVALNNITANQANIVIAGTPVTSNTTYTISGTVKNGTTALQGVTVTATSNGVAVTSVTNASGTYSFTNLTAGQSYTLAASNAGQSFTPATTTFANLSSNQTLNFSLVIVNTGGYLISGVVKNGNAPVGGVKVEMVLPWADNTHPWKALVATTDASGKYFFENAAIAGYPVYSSIKINAWENGGVVYLPGSYPQANVPATPQTFDFNTQTVVVTPSISIAGSVRNGTALITNVTVKLLDANNAVLSTITSTDGNYSFANLTNGGSYKVTAEKQSYTFNTVTLNNVTTNQANIVIAGTPVINNTTYTISGTVKNGTTALQGVTVTATSNGVAVTSITNAGGAYSFANLTAGQSYTVAASNAGQSFTPATTTFTNLSSNQTLNFSLVIVNTGGYLISGVVKNGNAPVGGVKVELVLPWADNTHPWKALLATTDATGKYFFENAAIAGYPVYSSIKINAWENGGVVYSPGSYPQANIPTTPQVFNFNTQTVVAVTPVVAITAPTAATISLNSGAAITFTATASLSSSDGTTTLSAVGFKIDGQNITATNTSGNVYTSSWTPAANQFQANHELIVTGTASNGSTASASYKFNLVCTGSNCPNALPVVTWNTPSNTTITQANFQTVPIAVTATDADGSISSVSITVNGVTATMASGANNTFTYNFLPNGYKVYPVVIKATDNRSGVTTFNNNITIVNQVISNRFNPLPNKVIMGYAHGFPNGAPNLRFTDIAKTKYNVIQYAFIETANRDGFTPVITANEGLYVTNGSYNSQLLKDDIKAFRAKGIPVIASIGGQNGHVVLDNVAQKNTFVAGLKNIIDQYGFDGIDLDFEGGSMNFGAGGLRDISYAGISAYPRLKNVVDACKELKAFYGPGFLLTAAPETQYVQGGYSNYSDTYGSFLPVIHNLRNELDLLAVQLYNTGGENGLDGQYYGTGKGADFLDALTDMLIKGFKIASTGMQFQGLPASKILFGLPCNLSAAGSGYQTPATVIRALNYMRFATTFPGRTYTLQPGGPHPTLRGVMTWSINWDASTSYEFVNAYSNYFATSPAQISTGSAVINTTAAVNNSANIKGFITQNKLSLLTGNTAVQQVNVYNIYGRLLLSKKFNMATGNIEIIDNRLLEKQIYVVDIIDREKNIKGIKVF